MLTPAQCRAARGFLNWTLADLAAASGLSRASLNAFEGGKANAKADTVAAIAAALEKGGIEFTAEGAIRPRINRIEVLKLEGPKAFEHLMDDIFQTVLRHRSTILLAGYEDARYQDMPDLAALLRRQVGRYRQHAIKEHIILRDGDRTFGFPPDVTTYRWLDRAYVSPFPMAIYGNKQAITVFEPQFTVIITESPIVANAYREQFNNFWNLAKPVPFSEAELLAQCQQNFPLPEKV